MSRTNILIGLLSLLPSLAGAVTLNVPSAECPTIQAGVDSAQVGDTVLVADGTYIGDGNRDLEFQGKDIILRSQSGPESTIIDCEGSVEENHRAFCLARLESADCLIEGFTIRNVYNVFGGDAVYIVRSSPSIAK